MKTDDMQRVSFVCHSTVLLLVATLVWQPMQVAAGMYEDTVPSAAVREYFYADDSGLVYRGGIALRDAFGVHGRKANIAELGLNADRDLCSMTGLWANYQALFRLEILEDIFIGLVGNIAEAAIWTAFCSAEPVLCDLVKHMRAMARAGLQARLAQCGKIQDAAAEYGKDIWRESHKTCLEEKKKDGLSLDEAMEACGAHNVPLLDFVGKKVERFDLIDAALKTTNASPELTALAKEVLGEVTFSASGGTSRSGHAPGRVAAKYEQMAEEKEHEVIERLNRIHETGTVTEEDLLALSTPSVPMTPRYLLILARLPDGDRQVAAMRLGRALAMDKLLVQVQALQEQLAAARKVPGGEAKARALEIEMRNLRREVDDLVYHKRLQEEFVAKPMLAVMAEVAGREQITASQVESGSTAEMAETVNRQDEELLGTFGGVRKPGAPQ
jgi:hypothetical protein